LAHERGGGADVRGRQREEGKKKTDVATEKLRTAEKQPTRPRKKKNSTMKNHLGQSHARSGKNDPQSNKGVCEEEFLKNQPAKSETTSRSRTIVEKKKNRGSKGGEDVQEEGERAGKQKVNSVIKEEPNSSTKSSVFMRGRRQKTRISQTKRKGEGTEEAVSRSRIAGSIGRNIVWGKKREHESDATSLRATQPG